MNQHSRSLLIFLTTDHRVMRETLEMIATGKDKEGLKVYFPQLLASDVLTLVSDKQDG